MANPRHALEQILGRDLMVFDLLEGACSEENITHPEPANGGLPTPLPLSRQTIDYLRASTINIRIVYVTVLESDEDRALIINYRNRRDLPPMGSFVFPVIGQGTDGVATSYLVTSSSGPSVSSFSRVPRLPERTTTLHPEGTAAACANAGMDLPGPDPSLREELYFIYGSYLEVTQFLGTHGFPAMSRLCTAAYYLFPYARENIHSIAFQVDLAEMMLMYPGAAVRVLPPGEQQVGDIFHTGLLYGLLSCQYTQENKMADQLYRRYKAGCSAFGVTVMSAQAYTIAAGNMIRMLVEANPIGLQVMGYCLAIDRNFEYAPNITTADLVRLTDLRTHSHLTDYAMAMLEQSRLVYAYSQHSTIKFGFAVIEYIEVWFRGIGGSFASDIDSAIATRDEIGRSPYSGLVRTLPEQHQVKSMARVAEVGLAYQGRIAADTLQGDNWGNYRTDSVAKHIEPQHDLTLCLTIAGLLPLGKIISLGTMVDHMSAEAVQVQLDTDPRVSSDAFAHHVRIRHPDSDWMVTYTRRRRLELLNEMETNRMAKITNMVNDQVGRLKRRVDINLDRGAARTQELAIEESGVSVINTIREAFSSLRDTLQAPDLEDHPDIAAIARMLANVMKNIGTSTAENLATVATREPQGGRAVNPPRGNAAG